VKVYSSWIPLGIRHAGAVIATDYKRSRSFADEVKHVEMIGAVCPNVNVMLSSVFTVIELARGRSARCVRLIVGVRPVNDGDRR